MDDEFGDAGLEVVEGVFVEIVPFGGGHTGFDGDDAIDDDIAWTDTFFKKRKIGKPAPRDENGEIIFVGDAEEDFE